MKIDLTDWKKPVTGRDGRIVLDVRKGDSWAYRCLESGSTCFGEVIGIHGDLGWMRHPDSGEGRSIRLDRDLECLRQRNGVAWFPASAIGRWQQAGHASDVPHGCFVPGVEGYVPSESAADVALLQSSGWCWAPDIEVDGKGPASVESGTLLAHPTPHPWTPPENFDTSNKRLYLEVPGCWIDFDDVDHDEQVANIHLMLASPALYRMAISGNWTRMWTMLNAYAKNDEKKFSGTDPNAVLCEIYLLMAPLDSLRREAIRIIQGGMPNNAEAEDGN